MRDRTAGLFLTAVVVSGFGTSAMWLAAGVWVKSLTGSASLAALAVFAMWLPVLFGPALGAVADRLRAGSVAVGLLAGPLLRRMDERVFAAAGTAVFAVAIALRALPYDAVALAGSAIIGFGLPCVLIAAMTAVQRETPDAVLGRTSATANTLMMVPNAVALALGAGLIALVDVRVLLPLTGAAALLAPVLLLTGRRTARGAGRLASRRNGEAMSRVRQGG
ncbi:MFS transporter permease [Streptomyces sp. NPDC058770]|uniref:MFS transporter permease n=1 Tax=unclassified Streptomyces TaxID=2593676 RepID=UPI0036A6DCF5